MKSKKENGRYKYSFIIIQADTAFPEIVDITRNNVPYCRFSNGSFLDYNSDKTKNMSIDEKVKIWKHINYYADKVDDHELVLNF